ncbi:MAG: hypothetical protein ACRCSM_03340 [Sediminibacterium sp.]|nr:hypothetical protein [Chitinophagaceae bacterium]MCA6447435.1 hypothetical protein [Chitinophagaceae bacterium]
MKKALAILSLSIYLFGATEAYQLLKLPLFIKHYIIHKSANKHISIAGFIKIHYLDPLVVDDDFDQDMRLPFKTHESVSCTITAISLPTERMVIDIPFTASLPARNFFFKEVNYSFDHLPTIFQPPRIV